MTSLISLILDYAAFFSIRG